MNETKLRRLTFFGCVIVLVLTLFGIIFNACRGNGRRSPYGQPDPNYDDGRPYIDVQLLTPNDYSRPCLPTEKLKGIVIHYVGNPGSTAQANRDYFEGLKDSRDTHASSNFIVGLEGEIIQCIPLNEKSSATNDRNRDTISIEVCHPDATGQFTQASYDALVKLTAWLCDTAGIGRDQVIRHYDVTGKLCPLYFVEHEEAWTQFLADVAAY